MQGKNAELLGRGGGGGGGIRHRRVTPWYFVGFFPDTVCPVASLRSSTSDQKRKEKTNLTGH